MSFVDILTPYIPELLGVVCFILGYLLLSVFNKPTETYSLASDFPSLIQESISEGYTEKAILYLDQYSIVSELPDIKIFNAVLRSCCDLKLIERAAQIFENMKQNPKIPRPTIETYEILASTMNDARKSNRVVEIINEVPATELALSELLQCLALECFTKQSRFDEAAQIFEISDFKPTLFPKFLQFLLKTHNNEKALHLVETYSSLQLGNEVLCSILESLNACESPLLAIELFKKITTPTPACYQVIARAYTKANCLEEGISILGTMTGMGIIPEESITTGIIDICGKTGKLKKAETVYNLLKSTRIPMGVVTFNALIEACVRCQKMATAWELLDEMNREGCVPDNFTYSSLIKGIKNEGENANLERAFGLLSTLKAVKSMAPDEILYNCLLDACISTKKIDKALELFNEMPSRDEISYNTLIKGFSQGRHLEKAIEILETMKKSGVRPNEVTYNSIIDTCIRCNQSSMAWRYLDEMEASNLMPDNFTYSTLVKGIKGDHCNQELYRIFRILERGRISPDEVLYNCLIDACVRVGDVNKAVEVFNQMKDSEIEASSVTYGIMIKAYGQANMLHKALATFKEMKGKGLKANDVTYGCLLDACVRSGEVDMAQDIFTSMHLEGIALNTILYTTMIKGYAKTQNLQKALELFKEMKKDVQPNNVTYNSLLDCAVRCEDMCTANKLFLEMQQLMKPDLISYSTMIKGLCKAGEVAQALHVLNTMKENAINPDEVLFNSLLDGCAKIGNLIIAEQVYTDMKSLSIRPSNVTYSILIKLYGKNKQVNRALEVLEDMKKEKVAPGMIVYTCLLQACIRCKQIQKALQIYSDMTKNGVRGDKVTFNTLVNGCVYARQMDSAYKITIDSFGMNVRLADDVYNNLLTNLISAKNPQKTQWAAEISEKMRSKGYQTERCLYAKSLENSGGENYLGHGLKRFCEKKIPMNERNYNLS